MAIEEAIKCAARDITKAKRIVIGNSVVIQPAASLPAIAKRAGAMVIEINPEPTPITGIVSDYLIEGKAGEVLPRILSSSPLTASRDESNKEKVFIHGFDLFLFS